MMRKEENEITQIRKGLGIKDGDNLKEFLFCFLLC